MSILLCYTCYCWLEPRSGLCPACHHPLDASIPDTAPDVLAANLGVVESRIGEIRVGRTNLPLTGVLYATTQGLFFAPHHVERVARVVGETVAGHSVMWWCASIIWSPLSLLLPFVKTRRNRVVETYIDRPQVLVKGDSDRLGQLLMQSPGCFFLSHSSVRLVYKRRRNWIVERSSGNRICFSPVSDNTLFEEQLLTELNNDRWSGAIVPS